MTDPTITTSRLILRPFTEEDVDPLHRILGEPDMLRYFPGSKDPPREAVQRLMADGYGFGAEGDWSAQRGDCGRGPGHSKWTSAGLRLDHHRGR